MSAAARWPYYRRILRAYLVPGRSQLTFWHETPEINQRASFERLGEYYMLFREKAHYAGHFDASGIPLLDYHGTIGLQYNPIAIAQWGLANYNIFGETREPARKKAVLKSAEWLAENLERNSHGLWVWNHHFDWEYRDLLKAPWYSGLAQGQGVSLLLRAHGISGDRKYKDAADAAFVSLTRPISDGGVLFEDADRNLWIEEYVVDPPTHILNGFIWALWGVFDYALATSDRAAQEVFARGVETLRRSLTAYDTGYWSLYELTATTAASKLKMIASPFYHRLHTVQLRVMTEMTGDDCFSAVAKRWEQYARSGKNRARALAEKSAFKLLNY
jgi:heparosan-N-sulfate-glucuronate 5-epimerase